jgi:Fic family protein
MTMPSPPCGGSPRLESPRSPTERLVHRIRGEFLEMPGLRLTLSQAARLWHLDLATCAAAFIHLVSDRFLQRTAGGAYVRADRP